MQEARARSGSTAENAFNQNLTQTLKGDFLNSNPYLDATFDKASGRVTENFTDAVMPGINATFGSGGRTGSGLHTQAIGDAQDELGNDLSGLATDIYGGNYQQERNRMMHTGS